MAIITLTSDLGLYDHYVAAVKGKLLSHFPQCQIVDITHQVTPFDYIKAARVLKNCFFHFPEGTIHMVGITTDSEKLRYVAVEHKGHYFLAPDNGFFAVLLDETPQRIVTLNDSGRFPTFSIFSVLADAAITLLRDSSIDRLGTVTGMLSERSISQPYLNGSMLVGQIVYIDVFRNIITNIHKDLFEKHRAGRKFLLDVRGYQVNQVHSNYDQVVEGELVALFNSSGFLEIALNRGDVARLFAAKEGDNIAIEFL